MRKRIPMMVAGAVSAVLAAGLFAPVWAAADPDTAVEAGVPAGFTTWGEVMGTQMRLNTAADRLGAAAAGHDGFGGITVPTADRQVRLYWKGDVPAHVSALARELTGAGTRVVTLPAAYSSVELSEARQWLQEVDKRRPDVTITSIGSLPGGAGLDIDVAEPADVGGAVLRQNIGGVHLDVATGPSIELSRANRAHDRPAWMGGGLIIGSETICTAGFGANRRSDGMDVLVTAGHCGNEGEKIHTSDGQLVGNLTGVDRGHDTALITVSRSAAFVYSGTEVTSGDFRGVSGVAIMRVGNYVCTSGAYSGERCGAVVEEVDVNVPAAGISGLVVATMPDGSSVSGAGDSGGPVYVIDEDGRALGAGTITGRHGEETVKCTGVVTRPDWTLRECGSGLYFAPLAPALARHGLTLNQVS